LFVCSLVCPNIDLYSTSTHDAHPAETVCGIVFMFSFCRQPKAHHLSVYHSFHLVALVDFTMSQNSESSLSLQTCSSQEMASWLLQHRFDNNEMELTTFLLEAVSSLPNAQAISDQLMNDDGTGENASPTSVSYIDSKDIGTELLKQGLEISFTAPRSKFQVTFGEDGMKCLDKHKDSFVVSAVEHIILFPKPQDCQKAAATDQVLLVLKDSVQYKKKSLQQLCFALPTSLPEWKSIDEDEEEEWSGLDHSDQWTRVL